MKAPLIHVANLVFNEPLAILPEKLEAILHAIGPRLTVDRAALDQLAPLARTIHTGPLQPGFVMNGVQTITTTGNVGIGTNLNAAPIILAPAAQMDDDDEDGNGNQKPYKLTPDGIAVIPVRGTLMKRNSWMSSMSGLSSYASIAQASTKALGDSLVKAVLFDIDSPGGTTHGCFELSDVLYGMRGDKPLWAVANDLAASAAYALASSVDRVYVTRTAGVGSIGVFALHADQSGMDEQAGLKFTYIFAGEKKTGGNPHEPLSKSARADIQAEVDREYDIFVATVARNRGFADATPKKIRATEASVLFADNAMPLLADEVGSYEDVLEALTAKVNGSKAKASGKLAISAESGNNAPETPNPPADSGEPKEGDKAMAGKLETDAAANDEMKRGKKAKDPECADPKDSPKDDEDEDDEEDGDEKKEAKGKKAAVTEMPLAANGAAVQIATLCQIAGAPELAAEYLMKGYDVNKVIEKLSARRAKASAENGINSYVTGENNNAGASRVSVDAAIEQARVMAMNSGGRLTQSRCMETILRGNPAIYEGYLEERGKVAAQVSFTGGGRALTDYVLNHQRRYMANLGLSTSIEDVPGRRAMA